MKEIFDLQEIRSAKLLVGRGELSDLEKKMIVVYDHLATLGITLAEMSNEIMELQDRHLAGKTSPLVRLFTKFSDGLNDLIEDQFDYIEFLSDDMIEELEDVGKKDFIS